MFEATTEVSWLRPASGTKKLPASGTNKRPVSGTKKGDESAGSREGDDKTKADDEQQSGVGTGDFYFGGGDAATGALPVWVMNLQNV